MQGCSSFGISASASTIDLPASTSGAVFSSAVLYVFQMFSLMLGSLRCQVGSLAFRLYRSLRGDPSYRAEQEKGGLWGCLVRGGCLADLCRSLESSEQRETCRYLDLRAPCLFNFFMSFSL